MNKKIKKITSPILLTLGALSISGLVAGTLISNSNSTLNNDNNSLISNIKIAENRIEPPIGGIITNDYVRKVIANKKTIPGWDGSLVETDFVDATSVALLAFENITEVSSVIFPNSVTDISFNAFLNNTSIKSISALGATSISFDAFKGTTGIINKGIKLTYSAKITISNIDIWGTSSRYVYIKPTEPYPEITGGVITSTFIDELIYFRSSWSDALGRFDGIFIADEFIGATSVAPGAFQNDTQVTAITLPNSVKSLGANAFNGATNLTSISALGVTNIGANAFNGIIRIYNNGIKLTYRDRKSVV